MSKAVRHGKPSAGAIGSGALFSLGVLIVILLGAGFVYLNQRQKAAFNRQIAKLEVQKESLEAQPGKDEFAVTVAKAEQQKALNEMRSAANHLQRLKSELTQLLQLGSGFPTNGSSTNDPARRYFENALTSSPTLDAIQTRTLQLQSALAQIEIIQGTGVMPDSHLVSDSKATGDWASTNAARVMGFREELERITQASPAASEAKAVEEDRRGEKKEPAAEAEQSSTVVETTKAAAEELLHEVRGEAARILQETKEEASRILFETRKEASLILAAARENLPAPVHSSTNEPSQPLDEAPSIEAADQERSAAAAPEELIEVKQSPAVQPQEARVQAFEISAEMRRQLLPFTTPGTMRLPGMFRAQRLPISFTQLKNFGALEPTPAGLERLIEIASSPQDAIRPRWKFKKSRGARSGTSAAVEQAKVVQRYLIDFGPQLVQEGLLAE